MSVNLRHTDTELIVSGERYRFELVEPGIVRLSGRTDKGTYLPYADLKVGSGAHPVGGESDISTSAAGPDVTCTNDLVTLRWTLDSSVWKSKTCVWECRADHLDFHIEISGEADLARVCYFEGLQGQPPTLYRFSEMMTSEVSLLDRRYYKPMEYACIDATSGTTSERPRDPEDNNHWLFTPPPFVYAWSCYGECWMGAGLAPEPGEYNFSLFEHWPVANCFMLRVTYDGMTRVEGKWKSPRVMFVPADDEYDCVRRHSDLLRQRGMAPRVDRTPADWWTKPMFCGWGEQNMTSVYRGGRGPDWARQDAYDEFIGMLKDRNIDPGTIVIDDKWQQQYGTCKVDSAKWPALRGWIDARHQEGRHVLLWLGCWSAEGLSPEMCVTRDGSVVCADPSSPAYEQMLREAIRTMLSSDAGCYNADGFKVDWTNGLPACEGFQTHGSIWGVELLKRLYWIIYDEAKRTKPDALIVTHCANPYFSDVTDMIRLNDISSFQRDMVGIMRHRQRLALAADSGWLIDCDNSSSPTHDEWFRYVQVQPELGVPSLYFITGVDGTGEPIPLEDWLKVPEIWHGTDGP